VQSTEAIIRFNKNGEGRVVSLSILGAQEAMQYWREGEQPVRNPF